MVLSIRRPVASLVLGAGALLVVGACSGSNFSGAGDKAEKKKSSDGTKVSGKSTEPGNDFDDGGSGTVVDCREKSASECEDKVRKILKEGGDKGPNITVRGCADDGDGTCEKIDHLGDTPEKVRLVDANDPSGGGDGGDGKAGNDADQGGGKGGGDDDAGGGTPGIDSDDGATNEGEAETEDFTVTCTPGAANGPIDFETLTRHEVIADQYKATYGVTFHTGSGSHPFVGEKGGTFTIWDPDDDNPNNQKEGWDLKDGTGDMPAAGYDFGRYFLTTTMAGQTQALTLLIEYDPPTAEASFDMIDLDDHEKFVIEAFTGANGAGTSSDRKVLCGPTPPDGKDDCTVGPVQHNGLPTHVEFAHGSKDIKSIKIVGKKSHDTLGIAFDNFSARKVCK